MISHILRINFKCRSFIYNFIIVKKIMNKYYYLDRLAMETMKTQTLVFLSRVYIEIFKLLSPILNLCNIKIQENARCSKVQLF